jgi:hypothetical protein
MKNILNKLTLVAVFTLSLAACREAEPAVEVETKETTIIREVEVQKPAAETKEKPGILERTANKVDGEINKEADKIIDEIGDDN